MTAQLELEMVHPEELEAKASRLKEALYRLVQVSCTSKPDHFEVTYSFDKDNVLKNLRVQVPRGNPVIPSITTHFFCAFTYENEIQDLFGLKVKGLALDFGGKFYRTAQAAAFAACATPAAGAPPPSTPQGRA